MPGHELSGVVAALGYGTTGLTVGRRVFGLADWTRNGSLAEYAAVEARNLAPLPADVDHTAAAALPISGLTAWQGLFDHGRPDRRRPRRRRRCRLDRGTTRARGGSPSDRHRPGRRQGRRARSRRARLPGPAGRSAGRRR
ncbi:alcohol dehydrogenase catalytic domain-containing protein [Actinomadura mexicana]|uniref:alcohol dehydrogenase catalytic domain-containing protein n=1 Tax=Actinomadura mexicana TaxID=134959 RepID=UPI003CCBA9BF